MRTTLDLPDRLVMEVKLRALRDHRKLKDMVAELLEKGLSVDNSDEVLTEPVIVERDSVTGLPVVRVRRAALPGQEITPERISEILLAQEAEWYANSR